MKCYWLLNHEPTERQRNEIKEDYGAVDIIMPKMDLSSFWGNIPCTKEIGSDLIDSWLDNIEPSDIAIVQGECTYVFYVVDALLSKGVRVLSSVSERKVEEKREGEVVLTNRYFEHKLFREYKRYRSL